MELILLNKDEVKKIYFTKMTEDFPENELKPLNSIFKMMDDGAYDPLAVVENNKIIGYAFIAKLKNTNYILLDYLAIFIEYRQKSAGSRVLAALKSLYSDKIIFIESENPDFMDKKEIPNRRLNFYKRNNCVDTNVLSVIWDAPYINMYLTNMDIKLDTSVCLEAISGFYKYMIKNEETYKKHVKIYPGDSVK